MYLQLLTTNEFGMVASRLINFNNNKVKNNFPFLVVWIKYTIKYSKKQGSVQINNGVCKVDNMYKFLILRKQLRALYRYAAL